MEMPLNMQSTLILGLRGPDTHQWPSVKNITRWLRGLTFVTGDPNNMQFMGEVPSRINEKGPTARELEFCSQHFYSHLMHALEIVGYRYDGKLGNYALLLYMDMCQLMHLPMET